MRLYTNPALQGANESNAVSLNSFRSPSTPSALDKLNKRLARQVKLGNIDRETKDALMRQNAEALYGTETFDQEQFDTLLNKLTGSKMNQQRQRSVEKRRDIYTGGLASMMRNF
jgi:hypothetical protein